MKTKTVVFLLIILLATLTSVPLISQEFDDAGDKINLNQYYRYPVSISAIYQPLAGLGSRALEEFTINEIAGEVRMTLPGIPVLQPLVRGGYLGYTFMGDLDESNQDWSHYHVYGGPGIGYSGRISKEFEIGADLFAGISRSIFNNLVLQGESLAFGQMNFITGASARLILNPAFNISISVSPSIRYIHGFGEPDTYNGFTYGVGFSLSYRFGQDPDAAGGDIRAIRFSEATMPPVFSAMQSYYTGEPLAVFTITNTEKVPVEELSVSFMQAGYMDSPTPLQAPSVPGPW